MYAKDLNVRRDAVRSRDAAPWNPIEKCVSFCLRSSPPNMEDSLQRPRLPTIWGNVGRNDSEYRSKVMIIVT